jgi:hypothetical protein
MFPAFFLHRLMSASTFFRKTKKYLPQHQCNSVAPRVPLQCLLLLLSLLPSPSSSLHQSSCTQSTSSSSSATSGQVPGLGLGLGPVPLLILLPISSEILTQIRTHHWRRAIEQRPHLRLLRATTTLLLPARALSSSRNCDGDAILWAGASRNGACSWSMETGLVFG